ncbi:hypothetical protein CVT25_012238 [Psilocybe cyanescens]|uniref:PPM-type phosphatase domain-containing protein n=1 Tax=Psilocybe cyanescens TaxID=93625 RepID=A0A409XFN6_PSICY|nr:hypothetical protein CVT25_012238 [Psilocybe cyanescens]
MDAKLKALKVVDLKSILSKAHVSVPAKATKTDLIAKIQASKPALDVYASLYPPDDLLAPPEEVDWNVDQLESPPPQPVPKQQKPAPVAAAAPASEPAASQPTPATEPPTQPAASEPSAADVELEKRRQRAARFGIPLVEPQQKKPRAPAPTTAKSTAAAAAAPSVDPKVLEQRAARFGTNTAQPKSTPATVDAKSNGKKRPAPQTQEVDPEELERRKKRAERFGTATDTPQSIMTSVKKTTDMGWPQADALWIYTSLSEPLLSSELERLSFANTVGDTDVVTFQPCPNPEEANQDRFVIKDWQLPNGTWIFRAVFDGHAGHETADYAAATLPDIIKGELAAILAKDAQPSPSAVSDALSHAISNFDKGIGQAIVNLFPDEKALAEMPVEDIQRIINDNGPNSDIVLRCMRGTTALISLVDPAKSNIWVASLGDCAAVLGVKGPSGEWSAEVLSRAHNGENEVEAETVRQEHPGESECVLDDRVLGAIAVTRALGDFSFKLPAAYTERIFLNSNPGFLVPEKVRSYIGRNKTPPYMSGVPEVQHVCLEALNATESFLILCSDGMMDLYEDDRLKLDELLSKRWVSHVGEEYKENKNLALSLLRDGLGGDSEDKVSRMITVEMAFKWMDDTTILVVRLTYNMKRRVASLPPISVAVFNQKVLERRTETAIMSDIRGSSCDVCNKLYTTENAYRSHIQSKKHRENEAKSALKPRKAVAEGEVESAPEASASTSVPVPAESAVTSASVSAPTPAPATHQEATEPNSTSETNHEEQEGSDDDELIQSIDQKIAAARSRLSENNCLFCTTVSPSLEANLTHMSTAHSFFIPDAEYLVDISGLITYLGEKIAVGNVCIHCNQKGKEFRSMDAVRKHMIDKAHCKIAYEREKDRLEISDFYDFTASYPDGADATTSSAKKSLKSSVEEEVDEEWEDAEDVDDDEVDEIVDESDSDSEEDSDSVTDSDEDDLPDNQLTYGDSAFELVLPSGARIGHRTMRRYYAQSFPGAPRGNKPEDPNSGAALVRRLLADKNSALVPSGGGFGAFGHGTEVVKARNRGEAREAGRHVREFRDQKRREDFKTKVGFIHNSQKHYRDPLLQ